MPLDECSFVSMYKGDIERPWLGIKITNPHTNKSLFVYGLVDTGADECAIPASYAELLGHILKDGEAKKLHTGSGETIAYSHTTIIEIYHTITKKHVFTIEKVLIDFTENLSCPLLGVNNFLNKFILKIDYPNKTFSIKYP